MIVSVAAFAYLRARQPQFSPLAQDYTYTELTSSSVKALAAFRRHFPAHRPELVKRLIDRGTQFVRDQQRDDGSWYGSWAVCFT